MDNNLHRRKYQLTEFKFAQLNVNKSPTAMTAFANFSESKSIDVMCVTEPPIRKTIPNINRRLNVIYCQSNEPNGPAPVRACICVLNKRIQPIMISHLSSSDCTVCQLGSVIIVAFYAQPYGDMSDNWTRITTIAAWAGVKNLIVTGDFNSDHQIWFSHATNNRGCDLLTTFIQSGLSVVNNTDTPTFDTIRGNQRLTSHTDLTVASSSTLPLIKDWKVNSETNFSDHRVITFMVNINGQWQQPPRHTTVRWNTNNANWDAWADSVKNSLEWHNLNDYTVNNVDDPDSLDLVIASITTIIKTACDENLQKFNVYRRRKLPWHNDGELNQLANDQKRSYRKIRRYQKDQIPARLLNEYCRLRTGITQCS